MAIPRIKKEFKAIVKETAKAICFLDFDKTHHWIPKSVCTLIKQKKDKVVTTLAVFKFEEITGIEVEDMKTPFVSMGGKVLERHKVQGVELIESEVKPLFPVQRETLLKYHLNSRYHALFWKAGTGKTLCSLTLANSYYTYDSIDVVVVLCPAHLQNQWREYAEEVFNDLPIKILSIQSTSFDKSLTNIIAKYNHIQGRKHLIIDESHYIKNQGAKRTKNIYKYIKSDFTTLCTATPIGRNAGDLYYQFAMLDTAIINEENYNSFQKHFLLLGGQDGEKVVALQNTKALSDRISPYISFLTKKDIRPNQPPKKYVRKEFEMSTHQRKAITYINGLIHQIQSKTKNGYIPKEKSYQINGFLQKIASGFVPNEEELKSIFANLGTLGEMADNVHRIKEIQYQSNNNRIEALQEVLAKYNQSAIIWCKYIDEVEELSRTLPNSRKMFGVVKLKDRWQMCKDFRQGKFKYLIASLQLGNGLDLPEINLSINYTTTWDLINRKQLEDRTDRIISEHATTVIDLVAKNSIDERILEVLDYKEEIASIFNGKKLSE